MEETTSVRGSSATLLKAAFAAAYPAEPLSALLTADVSIDRTSSRVTDSLDLSPMRVVIFASTGVRIRFVKDSTAPSVVSRK